MDNICAKLTFSSLQCTRSNDLHFIAIKRCGHNNFQIKLLMFYNLETTNLTFVGNIWDMQLIDIALHNSK